MQTDAEIRAAKMRKYLATSRWKGIMARCHDPKHLMFDYYGGKGVKVAKPWHSFEKFYADVGDPPEPGMTIDRIDSSGDYAPGNWRWATLSEQAQNRSSTNEPSVKAKSVVFDDDGKPISRRAAAAALGCKLETLRLRLKNMRDRYGLHEVKLSDLKAATEKSRLSWES